VSSAPAVERRVPLVRDLGEDVEVGAKIRVALGVVRRDRELRGRPPARAHGVRAVQLARGFLERQGRLAAHLVAREQRQASKPDGAEPTARST
jgi:hypothetical protein